MSQTTIVVLVVIALVLVIGYVLYVRVISLRNRALEALSGVDVQLRKRHDLLPNVLKIARQFMTHEKGLLEEITALRSRAMQGYEPRKAGEVGQHLEAVRQLEGAMGRLMVAVEDYPDLRSSDQMLEAQQQFAEVEAHIAAARRFYNAAVTDLNNAVQIFPSSVIARQVGIEEMPYYEAEEVARQAIDADDYFKG